MILFLTIILISMFLYGLTGWAVSRFLLTRYIAKKHPIIWDKLELGASQGELSGYSGKLAIWITQGQYKDLNDNELVKKVINYQRSKFLAIPFIFISILGFVILTNANT